MNKVDPLEILQQESEELAEAKSIFMEYFFIKASWLLAFKSIFYPIKTIFRTIPHVGKKDLVLDCSSFEKYKRMREIIDGRSYIVHCADISTARGRIFFAKVEANKTFYRARYVGYWSKIFPIFKIILKQRKKGESVLANTVFYYKALQDLIHYQQFLLETKAEIFVTANEDSWNSSLLANLCRKMSVKNINVMHGRVYKTKQFYDCTVVYGRQSYQATRNLASSRTEVVMSRLRELSGKSSPQREKADRVLFFEQPFFWSYTAEMREEIFALLENLANDGHEVFVKSHPTETHGWTERHPGIKLLPDMSVVDAISNCDVAISYCSTVGLEVISLGIPVVYLNLNSILDEYVQIRFLKATAVSDHSEARKLINSLKDPENFRIYTQNQIDLLREEYSAAPDFKLG